MEESDTIENVKARLVDSKKLPAKFGIEMKVIFNGKQLEDGRTLWDYNVGPGGTLLLVAAPRG